MKIIKLNILIILLTVCSSVVFGQRKEVLNFEDELIKGDKQKPELMYLFDRKQTNFKKLIKLRENFIPEMYRTSVKMQKGGRGD